jgi:hypothetical protein
MNGGSAVNRSAPQLSDVRAPIGDDIHKFTDGCSQLFRCLAAKGRPQRAINKPIPTIQRAILPPNKGDSSGCEFG